MKSVVFGIYIYTIQKSDGLLNNQTLWAHGPGALLLHAGTPSQASRRAPVAGMAFADCLGPDPGRPKIRWKNPMGNMVMKHPKHQISGGEDFGVKLWSDPRVVDTRLCEI